MDKAYLTAPDSSVNDTSHGFLYEPTASEHWQFGQGKAGARFGATALMPNGHGWQAYQPVPELQNRQNFETMACTVFGSLNAWETLAKFLGFNDFPSNCSDRFNAILANITPQGGSPHGSAESIRKYGVIPEEVLPFSDNIHDWAEYYSPYPMDPAMITLGKTITNKFTLGHEYLFNGIAYDKKTLLKKGLERGPVCVSMYAWKLDNKGFYYKDSNDMDQHWIQLIDYEEGKYWLIFDQYAPFLKRIEWDTDFMTAKVYFLSRIDPNANLAKLIKIRDLCIQAVLLLTQAVKQKLGFKV